MPQQGCCRHHESVLDHYPEKKKKLDEYLQALDIGAGIGYNRSLLIHSLHKAQEVFGYLPHEVQVYIAQRLKITLGDVYGVISFYSFFTIQPPGEFKINVCTGTACFVRGSDKILQEFESELGITDGHTTADKQFSLGSLRCVGACSLAPVVMVNEKVYANATPKMVKKIIADCRAAHKTEQ